MNKTTTLVGIVAGLTGAGITYGLKSRDTIRDDGAIGFLKKDSSVLNSSLRISPVFKSKYENAIQNCREYVKRLKYETGAPGVVVGVSVDGEIIWEEGFGYGNLETSTPCLPETSMRIASISKSITMALLAKLHEAKKLNFDDSIHKHVPYFPRKKVDGKEVDITLRQLASHTSGVRPYNKKGEDSNDPRKEFYIKNNFDNIEKSVELFKDDELFFTPGTSYQYTTHGYTLISAVIEIAGKMSFTRQIQDFFKTLGLENTHLDRVQKIIYGRASYYSKDKNGRIINAELADLSYKWAGGGLISTVGDLLKFANAMLYCYQQNPSSKPGYLKKETIQEMWTPVKNTVVKWGQNAGYGLGWEIVPKLDEIGGITEYQKFHVGHTGSAVGASSVLMIFPREIEIGHDENKNEIKNFKLPQGVAVAILINLQNISCRQLGKKIADEFFKLICSRYELGYSQPLYGTRQNFRRPGKRNWPHSTFELVSEFS